MPRAILYFKEYWSSFSEIIIWRISIKIVTEILRKSSIKYQKLKE